MILSNYINKLYFMRPQQKPQKKANQKPSISTQSILNRKIVSPQKLKILVLAGNQLLNEHLQFLQKCVNLIKLDLSHNMITKLSEKIGFKNLNKLEVLQLHYNKLSNIEAIQPIFGCTIITYLTYHHNPIESSTKIQHIIVNSLPNLKLINNRIVYVEELSKDLIHERSPTYVNSELFQNWKSKENSQAYYLKVLNMQLQFIDNMWTFSNPIIIIQRAWKHFISAQYNASDSLSSAYRTVRSKLTSRRDKTTSKLNNRRQLIENHPLKSFFQQWKKSSQSLRQIHQSLEKCKGQNGQIIDKTYYLEPLEEYYRILRNMKVGQTIANQIRKIRRKIYLRKMAYVMMANLKMKYELFQSPASFYYTSGIAQNHKIFFNRNQKHLIDNFLNFIAEKFNKREEIHDKSSIQICKAYNSIRLVDPQTFTNKYNQKGRYSFCSLLWPSMRAVVMNRKKSASIFKCGFTGLKQLSYILNRDKILTKQQMKKSKEVFNRLKKFTVNQYESSLCYFQCKDEFIMKHLLRLIYYHNSKSIKIEMKIKNNQMLSLFQNYQQPFIIYVEKVLKRTCAAVIIQKSWRRYLSIKNQKEGIYIKMQKNRAAMRIQYFFRNCIYRHRHHFSNKLNRDLSIIKTNTIIYPLQLYMNLKVLYNSSYKGNLYKYLKLIFRNDSIGLSEEYQRPIFSEHIRNTYFQGQKIGLQSSYQSLDIYKIIHNNSQIKTIIHNNHHFISFTYVNRIQTCKMASIISLLSYQMYGRYYVFPLTKENTELWEERLDQYRKVKKIQPFLKKYRENLKQTYFSKQIKESGVFVYLSDHKFNKKKEEFSLNVQFYQKRYHNFPVKYNQNLSYSFINLAHNSIQASMTSNQDDNQNKNIQDNIINLKERQQYEQRPFNKQQFKQIMSKTNQQYFKNVNPFTVTMIDTKKLSFFQQSQKNLPLIQSDISPKIQLQQIKKSKEINKKTKIKQFYKNQIIKRQVQKQMKQTSLVAMREKNKQQKMMNVTLKNIKEGQRTQQLKNQVNKIKEFKNRLSHKKEEESDFIQQNNFVMQQQLRMIIMRNKMKEAEKKKEDNFNSRNSSFERNSEMKTVQSRKSSKPKHRFEEQFTHNSFSINNPINTVFNTGINTPINNTVNVILSNNNNVLGDQGSIINLKKKSRKPRANSIGAYIRDPSFVHGVFPQEYYPIQNRATTFYFPPVI